MTIPTTAPRPTPQPAPAEFKCRDCGAIWSAKVAADECEILDVVEAKQARREKG